MKINSLLHFVFLVLMLLVSQALFAGDLSKDEVMHLFSGKTVDAYHVKKDFDIKTYYNPDGSYKQVRDGENKTGKWRVKDDGYMCMTPDHKDKEFCRVITKKDDNYRKIKVKNNGKRIYIINYKNFADGDSL